MVKFPDIETFFPKFQIDTIEKEDTIKIRLSTILIDHPFYIVKDYSNKDPEFLKTKLQEEYSDMCSRLYRFYRGLCKHEPEKAKKLKGVDWNKYLKDINNKSPLSKKDIT